MLPSVELTILVAAVVIFQCNADWVSQYKDVRIHMLRPNYMTEEPVKGGLYAPQAISDVTGKVNQQRRQLFSWQPSMLDFQRR